MRQVTQTINIYTFENAPSEVKEKIRENIHCNWDIYDCNMVERISTLKKLAEYINGELDYSLSCVPSRGEYITIKNYDENLLAELCILKDDCPLTGVCYDDDIISNITSYGLNSALTLYIDSIHDEYESMLQDEYLEEFCECNGYEFTSDGKLF